MSLESKSINLDLTDCKNMECIKCKHIFFTEVKMYKTIPKLLVGSPQDVSQPFVLRKCDNCGYVEVPATLMKEESNKKILS